MQNAPINQNAMNPNEMFPMMGHWMIQAEDTEKEFVTWLMVLNTMESGIRTRSTAKELTPKQMGNHTQESGLMT